MSQPQRSHPYANDFFYDAEQPPATTRPQLSTSYPERPIQISAPYPFTRARSFPSAEWTSIPSPWSAPLSASATQTSFAQVQALPSRSSMSHVPTYLSDQLRNNVDTLDSPIDAQPVPIPSSSTQVYHDVYYGTQIPSQHIMGSSSLPSVYGDPPTHNGPGPYSTPGYPAQDLAPSSVTCVPPTFFDYSMPASAPMQHPAQWNTQSFGPGQLGPFNAIAPTATQATVAIPSSYSSTPLPASSSSTSANFRRSESSADRSSKQFKCDICPQSFNRNHDLKRHKRIHLTIKPFPCGWCEKTFSRKDALRRHFLVRGCGKGQGQTQEASEAGISKAPGIVAIRQAIEVESRRQNCALPPSHHQAMQDAVREEEERQRLQSGSDSPSSTVGGQASPASASVGEDDDGVRAPPISKRSTSSSESSTAMSTASAPTAISTPTTEDSSFSSICSPANTSSEHPSLGRDSIYTSNPYHDGSWTVNPLSTNPTLSATTPTGNFQTGSGYYHYDGSTLQVPPHQEHESFEQGGTYVSQLSFASEESSPDSHHIQSPQSFFNI